MLAAETNPKEAEPDESCLRLDIAHLCLQLCEFISDEIVPPGVDLLGFTIWWLLINNINIHCNLIIYP